MSVRASKLNPWVFALGVAAALGPGCGLGNSGNPNAPSFVAPAAANPGPSPAATPVPSPNAMVIPDSDWQGTTSQRQVLSFTVTKSKISTLSILIWLNGRACHLPVTARPLATIDVDGTFDFSTNGAVVADFSGRFRSNMQMTGTFSVTRLNGPCDVHGPVSVSGTFAARKL